MHTYPGRIIQHCFVKSQTAENMFQEINVVNEFLELVENDMIEVILNLIRQVEPFFWCVRYLLRELLHLGSENSHDNVKEVRFVGDVFCK